MPRSSFRLIPFNVGECKLGKNHVLGDPHSDEDRFDFTLYVFLADGGPGRRILVDLGPIGLDYLNRMFRFHGFFRELPGDPDAIRQPHGNVFDWLKRFDLKPQDINHIILTHMHADHHGMDDAKGPGAAARFPNARIHVSRIGWQNNLDRRENGKWHSYVDFAFSDFLLEAEGRGIVSFSDNAEIVPGIETVYLGGHSYCSQAIRIRTEDGLVIIASDEIYHYSLFEQGVLARLNTTPEQLLKADERLADWGLDGAVLVPCHDPVLFELYRETGEAWLDRVAPISRKAAKGFKTAPKKALPRKA